MTNPLDSRQFRVFYSYMAASYDYGENRHALEVMRELSESHGFVVLDAVPQSIADGWHLWIECDEFPELPSFVRRVPWAPIGAA